MEESSSDNTFGMALQLKDLFWSAESFDAGEAMQAALDKKTPKPKRQKKSPTGFAGLNPPAINKTSVFSTISADYGKVSLLAKSTGSPAGVAA